MNLVLDASPLVRGQTGIGTYTREIALALNSAASPEDRIALFLNKPAARLPALDLDGWRPPARVSRIPRRILNRMWLDRRIIPIERWFPDGEVFHATDFLLPFSRRMRLVVMVHDLAWAIAPHLFAPSFTAYLGRWFVPSLRLAHAIITPSAAAAADLARLFGVETGRIHVIPSGASADFSPVPAPADRSARERLGVPERYVLAVGPIEPRKNLTALVAAFGALVRDRGRRETLVIAGPDPRGTAAGLVTTAKTVGLEQKLVLTGRVSRADLAALYRGASVFVYPSLMEGFGLPVLEAMACGAPVAASRAPAIPEAGGDAALYFDPWKSEDMAEAIAKVLAEPALAAELRERGLARARAFTWERAARATRAVHEGPAG